MLNVNLRDATPLRRKQVLFESKQKPNRMQRFCQL